MTEPDRTSDPALAATAQTIEQLGRHLENICTTPPGPQRHTAVLEAAEAILNNDNPHVTLAAVIQLLGFTAATIEHTAQQHGHTFDGFADRYTTRTLRHLQQAFEPGD